MAIYRTKPPPSETKQTRGVGLVVPEFRLLDIPLLKTRKAKKRVYKPRQFCAVVNAECLNPAGYRSATGVFSSGRASVLWECPTCGNPACKKCRGKRKNKTVCAHCAEKDDG